MSDNEQDEDAPVRDKSPSPPPPPPAKKPAAPAAVPPKTTTTAAPAAPAAAAATAAGKKPEPPKPAPAPAPSQFAKADAKAPTGTEQVPPSPYPTPNAAASASGSASAAASKPAPGQFSSKGKPATRTGYIAAVAPETKSLAAATHSELVDLKSLDQHLCAPDARAPEGKLYASKSPYFSKYRDILSSVTFDILPPFKAGKQPRIAIKWRNFDGKKEDLIPRLPFLLTTFSKMYPDGNWVDAFTKGADPNRNTQYDPKTVTATRVKRGLSILPWSKHEVDKPLSAEGEKARTLLRLLNGMYVLFGIANRKNLGKRFDEVVKDFQVAFETKAIGAEKLKEADSGMITPELILATERCSHVKPLFPREVVDKNGVKHTLADGTTVYTSNYLFRMTAKGEQAPKTEQDKLRLGYPPVRHPHRRVVDRLCELAQKSVAPEEEAEEDDAQNHGATRIYNVIEMTKPNGAFPTWEERLGYGRGTVISPLVRVKEKAFPETTGNVGLELETVQESVLLVKPVVRKRIYEELDHSAWLENNQDELTADLPDDVIQESNSGGEGSASGGAPASGSASASASATSARGADGQSSPKRTKH